MNPMILNKILTWKEQRRGATLKLIFSVRCGAFTNEMNTEPINVDNLALILFKFKVNSALKWRLEPRIGFKRHEKANDSSVNITVSYSKFEKQCPCADYWIEYIKLEPVIEYDKNFQAMCRILSYVLEVSVTVHSRTSEALYTKLYKDMESTDFYLRAADGMVAVHKVILGIHSFKFRAMLNAGEWIDKEEGHIPIEGVTIQTLQHLKEYMYLKTLPNNSLQLQQLLLVASCYFMIDLTTECIDKLVKLVTLDNFDSLIEFACYNNLPQLMKAIATEIPDNIVDGINEIRIKRLISKK